jgi:hypothetical protein
VGPPCSDPDARAKLNDQELEPNLNLDHRFERVDTNFKRVFGA